MAKVSVVRADDYIRDVIKKGDEGSALLAAITAPTIQNSKLATVLDTPVGMQRVMGQLDDSYAVVVHGGTGEPRENDLRSYGASFVKRLVRDAQRIGAQPHGIVNIIDTNTGEPDVLKALAGGMVEACNKFRVAVYNGENAILGSRVRDANISGAMISILRKSKVPAGIDLSQGICTYSDANTTYVIFDPMGNFVFGNADGIGTKTEFYERAERHEEGIGDLFAMCLDDKSKFGAKAKAFVAILETRGSIGAEAFGRKLAEYAALNGVTAALHHERMGNRIMGYRRNVNSYNMNGVVVSTVDPERMANPLIPNPGDYLVAIAGILNPRSNGITAKRKLMIEMLGRNWHKTPLGRKCLEYLAQPSTVLAGAFDRLIDGGYGVTAVFHNSGGALDGKLARPLAKRGLYVQIDGDRLFKPHWVEQMLCSYSCTPNENAYAKWPMGTDGFFTMRADPEDLAVVRDVLAGMGLRAEFAGIIGTAKGGKTGVELRGIRASNGKDVYYSGKE